MDITLKLVRELVQQQFQKWAHLPLKPVAYQGHDHRIFHLGNDLLLRLPSAPIYAAQIEKEYHWLPFLASHICVDIPRPVAMGQATEAYPLPWGVYTWLPGTSANQMPVEQVDHHLLAMDLARFLRELWAIDASQGPRPGQHNFWRGSHLGFMKLRLENAWTV